MYTLLTPSDANAVATGPTVVLSQHITSLAWYKIHSTLNNDEVHYCNKQPLFQIKVMYQFFKTTILYHLYIQYST